MQIDCGFQIEAQSLFVPWGISGTELLKLTSGTAESVANGLLMMPCTSLSGLRHYLGFYFSADDRLERLSLFFRPPLELRRSFALFQQHLEATFGAPMWHSEAFGFPAYRWVFNSIEISHHVLDRFILEEYLYIGPFIEASKLWSGQR